MIVVTGGAGFIGSNIIKGLNSRGFNNILVVDDLTQGHKFRNLADLDFADYMDKDSFIQDFSNFKISKKIEAIFHQGACSNTTEMNGRYLMDVNYTYSKKIFHECIHHHIPFYYASSASVYGNGSIFSEARQYEKPINVYGFSKFQFDQYIRSIGEVKSPVVGLRYFNVYGPREMHKERMASVIFHFRNQLSKGDSIQLFDAYDTYEAGEQKRDFIHVDDVVAVNLWLLDNPSVSGIFNLGTGHAHTFNHVAKTIISFYGTGQIVYIPFPGDLKSVYQSYTQADMSLLRDKGCDISFANLESGVAQYLEWLDLQEYK